MQDIFKYFSMVVIINIIQFLIIFVLAKSLNLENFGLYKKITLYLGFSGVLSFGFREAIFIDICEQGTAIKRKEQRENFTFFIANQALISSLVYFLIVNTLSSISHLALELSLLVFLANINSYFISFFKGLKLFARSNLVTLVPALITFILISVSIYFIELTVAQVIHVLVISNGLTCILFLLINRNYFLPKKFVVSKTIIKKFSYGFPLLIGNVAVLFFDRLDQTFVSLNFIEADFAVYTFAATFLVLINFVLTAIGQVLIPYLFQDYQDIKVKLYQKSMTLLGIVSYSITILYLVAELFIGFFYDAFLDSLPILKVLLISAIFITANSVLHKGLFFSFKKEKDYMYLNLFIVISASALFLSLNLLGITSMITYAYMALLAFVVRYFVFDYYIRKKLQLNLRAFLSFYMNIIISSLLLLQI